MLVCRGEKTYHLSKQTNEGNVRDFDRKLCSFWRKCDAVCEINVSSRCSDEATSEDVSFWIFFYVGSFTNFGKIEKVKLMHSST